MQTDFEAKKREKRPVERPRMNLRTVLKPTLQEYECHTLPVFVFCVYFTFQRVIGLIYFPHPSRPVLGPTQSKGRKEAEAWP
jgi:hypothetical protein